MTTPEPFHINLEESFEHLRNAPIVEAVVDIRCRATKQLAEASLRSALEERLDGYGFLDSQREFAGEMKVEKSGPVSQTVRDLGWRGIRVKSLDGKHIAQFNQNGFVFSRLQPYQDWGQLKKEAMRLWELFCELAAPAEVQRVGLRFINRIGMPEESRRISDFIHPAPKPPRDLPFPFSGFMHQDTLTIPGRPYALRIARTIQSPKDQGTGFAIILDIDVFTTQPFPLDSDRLFWQLEEMRWLKNKAFFGSVTEKALEHFR